VDEEWAEGFRLWAAMQPVILSSGKVRPKPRSASTIENSLIQLAAAINEAKRRGDIIAGPQFKPIPTTRLNQTPTRRLAISELAEAFVYATDPQYPQKRKNLHAFLMAAVATAARPDAIYDISTAPERGQWNSSFGVLELNPKGRRQTKKYRASLKVPQQFAEVLDSTTGFLISAKSIGTAFDQMCTALSWPKDGQSGTKLIRRSIAQLLRDPARGVPIEQLEILLGHRRVNTTTDIYARFDPAYLKECKLALEGIIAEIEELCPRAFHRSGTGAVASKSGEDEAED
jgi:integrase